MPYDVFRNVFLFRCIDGRLRAQLSVRHVDMPTPRWDNLDIPREF